MYKVPDEEELVARFDDFYKKLLEDAYSSKPVDQRLAEESIDELYALHRLPPPEKVWVESPFQSALVANYYRERMWSDKEDFSAIRDKMREAGSPNAQYAMARLVTVSKKLADHNKIEDLNFKIYLGEYEAGKLLRFPSIPVDRFARAIPQNAVRWLINRKICVLIDEITKRTYTKHDDSHFSLLEHPGLVFYEQEGLISAVGLRATINLIRNTGLSYFYPNMAVLSGRPDHIEVDNQFRLHSSHRKAIEYSDGFGIYAWHGTSVPDNFIVDPFSYSPEDVISMENVELRRILIEQVSWSYLFEKLKAQSVAKDKYGEIMRFHLPRERRSDIHVVRVQCPSTGREYFIRIPANIRKPRSAVAWTFGLTGREYNPVVQT